MHDCEIEVDGTAYYCGPFRREWASLLPATPQVIVDVGAYDGGDSLRFRQWFPDARVVTLEPHPGLAAHLRGLGLEVYECAATRAVGEAEFHFGDHLWGTPGPSGSLYRVKAETVEALWEARDYSRQPVVVRTVTLAFLTAILGIAAIDILQIDAEGAEPDVIAGLGALRPKIVMGETGTFAALDNCPHTKASLCASMEVLGYRILEDGEYDTAWILERL